MGSKYGLDMLSCLLAHHPIPAPQLSLLTPSDLFWYFLECPHQYWYRYRYFQKWPYRYRYFSKLSIYRQSIFDIDISNRAILGSLLRSISNPNQGKTSPPLSLSKARTGGLAFWKEASDVIVSSCRIKGSQPAVLIRVICWQKVLRWNKAHQMHSGSSWTGLGVKMDS